MNNLTATLIHVMARRTGTELTPRHFEILDYVHQHYEANRVGPLYLNIKKYTGANQAEIKALFPSALNSVYTWVGIPIHTPDSSCKPMAVIDVEHYREVYLDHNATTYVRDEVRDLLVEHFQSEDAYGNPSSSTNLGHKANDYVQEARDNIASCLNVTSNNIIFTGCGSESNNFAIKGIAFGHLNRPGHIITSNIEHSAVLETMRFLETLGFQVTYLPCNAKGRISASDIKTALRPETILVSIMAVNNEIGTINPLAEIGEVCRQVNVPFMVDGVQAFGKLPLDPKALGISLLSISGHKIYAPKGVAALYVDESVQLTPLLHGGGQEFGLRSGTENVAMIRALGLAATLIVAEREQENQRLTELSQYFLKRLRDIEPNFIVNGSLEHRIPHNVNIGFPNIDSGSLLLSLNQIGIYVSSGSACHAGATEASHVIKALGVDTNDYGTVRFSFGLKTQKEDLDYLFRYLPEILDTLKQERKEIFERFQSSSSRGLIAGSSEYSR